MRAGEELVGQVEVGGLRIAYRREGAGPPVVFLHGFFGDHRVWRRQFELADERVEVIDEDEMPSVAGVLGTLLDEDVPVLAELPHRLGIVGEEGRRRAEEPLVPVHRRPQVRDGDSREQIIRH